MLLGRIKSGKLIEDPSQATERYVEGLRRTLIVSADTELISDIHRNCSYGPWKRALVKVDREENFLLRHGEKWMRVLSQDPEKKREVQRAVDWMFVLTLEWFGLPDGMKRHNEQIEYGYKGSTNDELRQTWMSHTVPLCESLGLDVPAHYDEEQQKYVIDCPFPAHFDAEDKRWKFED